MYIDKLKLIYNKEHMIDAYLCTNNDVIKTFKVCDKFGVRSTEKQLRMAKRIFKDEDKYLNQLYIFANGIDFMTDGNTIGLRISKIEELQKINREWKKWYGLFGAKEEYQKKGIAFGEIANSGNYFISFKGKVYYTDHEAFEDKIIADSISDFFCLYLRNPFEFLYKCGCYTRFFVADSSEQYIPSKNKEN